ncbi:MAG: hypothetical protein IPL55_06160 [Saprospiraceae bacterium]|jgi:outer membrane biosynthesis protein TonB|nr:hypothetical protein [Saprospiraceae bacterium]MBL0024827.1 hypothetical protein [Saprospiraceae bacterium]
MQVKDSYYNEDTHKNKGLISSFIIHVIILLLLLLPFLSKTEFEDLGGILIAFGDPDKGLLDDPNINESASTTSEAPSQKTSEKSQNENIQSSAKEDESIFKATENKKNTPKVIESTSKNNKQVEDSKIKEEAERKSKEAAEKAKAEQEAADLANQKKKYSDMLGKGQGNNNSSGNQGSEKGNPDGKALEGISKGSGQVGGGLNGRGVEYEPSFTDSSQKTGKVSLEICVNKDGKVSKADFTQKGSTTSDPYLVDLARKTALKYRFSRSEIELQCGTVTIDFKVM